VKDNWRAQLRAHHAATISGAAAAPRAGSPAKGALERQFREIKAGLAAPRPPPRPSPPDATPLGAILAGLPACQEQRRLSQGECVEGALRAGAYGGARRARRDGRHVPRRARPAAGSATR